MAKKGIIGRKIGMTQIFADNGEAVPITVVEAGPCVVVQKKTQPVDGYEAIQLGFGDISEKRLNKPAIGHLKKAGVKLVRRLREFKVDDIEAYTVGQEVAVDLFVPGDCVDVVGTSKGKGFAGGIKRHGFHRGPMTHGSKYHRRPGSAAAKGPARIFKGRKMPGRLGGKRVTVQNLEVVRVDKDRNLLLVKGAVPGPNRGLLMIKSSVKAN
ncbi:MAG: 50S ribosomal protein L3 [Heliobacteriaceae bacterium]|nr:50S ribosomal protein L3 [Heliobacteriaceae bacterium]MDD4587963.1 50S ribosomal protein L3 [Heliobacteriaceae bacterium]